jgi:hypothetical protein
MLAGATIVVAACHSSPATTATVSNTTSGGNPGSCPAAMTDVMVGESCSDEDACTYPDGRCWCGAGSYCGGVDPGEEYMAELRKPRWQCQAARTDGCPEQDPEGPCSEEGQQCGYGACCMSTTSCTDGQWVRGPASCPP